MTMPTLSNTQIEESIKKLKSDYIDFIRNRMGIVTHSHQINDLSRIIREGCEKFKCNPDEYLKLLKESNDQSLYIDHLISGITIGETYFFRDKHQIELIKNNVLPNLIQLKRSQNNLNLRIWSAGCASGEEIYTIAMLLLEQIPDIKQWSIKLLATDINANVLQKAISGVYTEWSMRSIPDRYRRNYFEKNGKTYQLAKSVIDMVTFDYLNLNDDSYPSLFNGTNSQDLILCRNVLIYFDNDSCKKLMQRLSTSLVIGGYLILGASDPVNIAHTDLIFKDSKELLFIRSIQEPSIQREVTARREHTVLEPKIKKPRITGIQNNKPVIKTETISKQSVAQNAIDLANLGELTKALELCEIGIQNEPMNKLNYFVHGLTLQELNRFTEAEASLRRSLFLDNQFVIGHFQLGMLLIRKKNYSAGLKYLQNALSIAEVNDPNEIVIATPGMTYQKLTEILRNEINIFLKAEQHHEE